MFKTLTIVFSIVLSILVGQETVDIESVDYSDVFVYATYRVPELPSTTLGSIIVPNTNKGCPAEGQCVYLLKERGFDIKGNAIDLRPNADEPCRGCAILMYGGRYGHVGIVRNYDSEYVEFLEKNFTGCGELSIRTLRRNASIIRGYLIQ